MVRPHRGMLSELHPAIHIDLSEETIGHARCAIACRSVQITRN